MLTAVTINITVFYPEYGGSWFLLNVTKFILGLHSVTLYSAQQLRTVTTNLKSFLVFLFLAPFYHIAYSPSNSMPCPNLSTETQFLVHTSNVLPPPSIPKGPCAFPMWAEFPPSIYSILQHQISLWTPRTAFVAVSNIGETLGALSPRRHMSRCCAELSYQRFVPYISQLL
jgi:hypothetical protein